MNDRLVKVIVLLISGLLAFGCTKAGEMESVLPLKTPAGQEPSTREVEEITFKKVGDISLQMKIYYPDDYQKGKKYPAIVLFFGGGWNDGSIDQFKPQAQQFAKLGMIAITPNYRVKSLHKTTPFESVKDARSAIRYLREHANKIGIDPDRLAAGGGSAGGHLAAATDLVALDNIDDNLTISARPNALVLFNPVVNNGPGTYAHEEFFENRYVEISPYHNIKQGGAPTIMFLGTKDAIIPVKMLQEYKEAMEANNNRCELFLYENQVHGFFNYKGGNNKYYTETMDEAVRFLRSLGYIK